MNLRPAVFFPLCALGLAAAFWAGRVSHAPEKSDALDENGAGTLAVTSRPKTAGSVPMAKPFAPGQVESWVRQINDAAGLMGQRVRIHAAQQCERLDPAGAEELARQCDKYRIAAGACFGGGWTPDRELLDELTLDSLARLSDLDPDRALEVLRDSGLLKDDFRCAATVLDPFLSKDPALVARFATEFEGDKEALLKELAPAFRERPEDFLQFLPACDKEPDAWKFLLNFLTGMDGDLGYRTIAENVLKPGGDEDWAFSSGASQVDIYEKKGFAEWAADYSGPDAGKLQTFALQNLLGGASEDHDDYTSSYAAPIFDKVASGLAPEDRESLAETIGQGFSGYSLKSAGKWLQGMDDGPVKEAALRGICQTQLELAKDPSKASDLDDEMPPLAWIGRLSSPVDHDEMTTAYVQILLARGDTEGAEKGAGAISNPGLKEAVAELLSKTAEVSRLQAEE